MYEKFTDSGRFDTQNTHTPNMDDSGNLQKIPTIAATVLQNFKLFINYGDIAEHFTN